MKSILPWLLLIIVSIQWIGGKVFYTEMIILFKEHQMSKDEASLSKMVQQKTGISSQVTVLENLPNLNSLGYSHDFVFSENLEGDTLNFILNAPEEEICEVTIVTNSETEKDKSHRNANLEQGRFFSDYTIPEFLAAVNSVSEDLPVLNSTGSRFKTGLFSEKITPPPRLG